MRRRASSTMGPAAWVLSLLLVPGATWGTAKDTSPNGSTGPGGGAARPNEATAEAPSGGHEGVAPGDRAARPERDKILAGSWTVLTSPTAADLLAVDALSGTDVWVVGADSTVLHTTNGGGSWAASAAGVPAGLELLAIDMVDSSHGWLLGASVIARTENGGASWTCWTLSTETHSIAALSATTVWGVGGAWDEDFPGLWDIRSARYRYDAGSLDEDFYWLSAPHASAKGVSLANGDVGWYVGGTGAILKITGASGSPVVTPQTSGVPLIELRSVAAIDVSTAYAVGDGGTILKTEDGGTNWAAKSSGTAVALNGIHCANALTCLVVGAGGVVRLTENGGSAWADDASGTTIELEGVAFPSPETAYAVGRGGLVLRRDLYVPIFSDGFEGGSADAWSAD